MKFKHLKAICLLLASFSLLLFTPSCSDDSTGDEVFGNPPSGDDSTQSEDEEEVEVENPDYTYPDSVTINVVSSVDTYIDSESGLLAADLDINDIIELSYSYSPEEIDVDKWEWSSSNNDVVNVDMFGTVVASSKGSAIVTISYTGSSRVVTDSMLLNVSIIEVESITLKYTADSDDAFAAQVEAFITPYNSSFVTVEWSSDNENVALVYSIDDAIGKIEGSDTYVGTGEIATITASAIDGSGVVASVKVKTTEQGLVRVE